jgi:hypothetical protein
VSVWKDCCCSNLEDLWLKKENVENVRGWMLLQYGAKCNIVSA